MLINVSALLQEPIGARREYTFIGEDVGNATVTCQTQLMRTDAGILVSARCDAEQRQTCSLCLNHFVQVIRFTFDEEYFPTIDIATGRRMPERDSSEDLQIDAQHHLDVSDAVRQYLIMKEPQNPVCRVDCKGLCPQCGEDRNTVSCKCPPIAERSEWATALAEAWASQQDKIS